VYIHGFLPDFSYKLEADIEPDEFKRFVRRMGFTDASRKNPTQYAIEKPEIEYRMTAEYHGRSLYFEEFKY
jgi:hypothetical protein